jgi:hypothetical protein
MRHLYLLILLSLLLPIGLSRDELVGRIEQRGCSASCRGRRTAVEMIILLLLEWTLLTHCINGKMFVKALLMAREALK